MKKYKLFLSLKINLVKERKDKMNYIINETIFESEMMAQFCATDSEMHPHSSSRTRTRTRTRGHQIKKSKIK